MHQAYRSIFAPLIITLLTWSCSFAEDQHLCPIGYTIAYKKYKNDDPICYRLKGPEKFADKFQECAGNLYTTKLYYSLNITETNVVLWTDYKTMYRGGPFIDWSYTDSIGDMLRSSNEVNYDPNLSDEEACVIVDPVKNFTATKCDEKHYRYCFVKPFRKENDRDKEGCEDLYGFWRLYSPRATCLRTMYTIVNWGKDRFNWKDAKEVCAEKGASLLAEDWRYASLIVDRVVPIKRTDPTFPLGIILSSDNTTITLKYDSAKEGGVIPRSEWNFEDTNVPTYSTAYVALKNNLWHLVNSSFLFSDVICERPIQLRSVMMNVSVHPYRKEKLVLTTNDTVNKDDIKCFTDSITYYPVKVSIRYDNKADNFEISPEYDGYYWCVLTDSRNHYVSESNKVLFIREKQSLANYYAVKISFKAEQKYDDLDDYLDTWQKDIEENLLYRMEYMKVFGELPSKKILKEFKASHPGLKYKERELIHVIRVKKYMRGKKVLLHAQLKPQMMLGPRGIWNDIMKPVYYCKGLDSIPTLPLGSSTTFGCRIYTCVGDFNEGVQWVTTAASGCTTTTSLPVSTKIRLPHQDGLNQRNISIQRNPEILKMPDEQLQQVMDDLNTLLRNNNTLTVDDIEEKLDQVNELLKTPDDLVIPGDLLHQLDELGTRIDLKGSGSAIATRSNVALLLADTGPTARFRGLRILARDADEFTNDTFQFICGNINDNMLTKNKSEAVVYLPDSIANFTTRISFVVFRNDRAFRNNHVHYSVNSRILSIKVDNFTHFDNGETVDIHLNPIIQDLDRNVTSSCAYWHFLEDGTGYWSQEGCTFTKSTDDGVLDICRCDHLTHFAEVIIPRSLFAKRDEDILEVLTIIGCCLSIFGICMVGVTAAVFKSWRRDYNNKIWLQLCVAILLLVVNFLITVFMRFERYSIPCMLVGVSLHYAVLASFCWMLVAAVLSYRSLVIVFTTDASHKLLRASVFSWGVPCAAIGVLLCIDPRAYSAQFEEKAPSGVFCYPSGLSLWLSVYAPITILLLANLTLFGLIVRSVFASRRIKRYGDKNEAVRCASVSCLLVFLFGLPWVFGLFAQNIVAAYLFTLTATYQGFVLFIFFVLGKKKTRDLWLNKLKIVLTRKVQLTSST